MLPVPPAAPARTVRRALYMSALSIYALFENGVVQMMKVCCSVCAALSVCLSVYLLPGCAALSVCLSVYLLPGCAALSAASACLSHCLIMALSLPICCLSAVSS